MATAAYLISEGEPMGYRNRMHHVYTTNTLASAVVANFFDTDISKFTPGDHVTVAVVDDLTKVPKGTAVVSGGGTAICVTGKNGSHVDLAVLASWTTNAS